MLTEKCI